MFRRVLEEVMLLVPAINCGNGEASPLLKAVFVHLNYNPFTGHQEVPAIMML